jgi:hypothetical protein
LSQARYIKSKNKEDLVNWERIIRVDHPEMRYLHLMMTAQTAKGTFEPLIDHEMKDANQRIEL